MVSLPAINVEKAYPCFAFSVWMPISLADPNKALFASILYAHVCITYFKTTYQPIIAHPSSGGARTKRSTVVSQTLSRRAFIL